MRDRQREQATCCYCEEPIVRSSDGGDDRPEYVHRDSRAPHCRGRSIFGPWCWPEPGSEVLPP